MADVLHLMVSLVQVRFLNDEFISVLLFKQKSLLAMLKALSRQD